VLRVGEIQEPGGCRAPDKKGCGALSSDLSTLTRRRDAVNPPIGEAPPADLPTELEWLRAENSRPYTPPPWAALPEVDEVGRRAGELIRTALAVEALEPRVRIPRKEKHQEKISTFGESYSGRYEHAASRCPKARHNQWFRGKESGRLYRFELLTCQRNTCPTCRRYLARVLAARLEARFEGLALYRLEVPEEKVNAARVRVDRRDGLYVTVPAPGNRRVVLSTVPATLADEVPYEVPYEERRAQLRDLTAHRPLDRRQVGSSRTKADENGDEKRAGSWLAEAVPVREALEYAGHDTSKADTETVEILAAEVNLPTTRVIDGPEVRALRLDAHPHDPRVEHLKRRLGFLEVKRATVTGLPVGDWRDEFLNRHRDGEQPPLECYPEGQLDFEVVAA
jgi:hypothetical protein